MGSLASMGTSWTLHLWRQPRHSLYVHVGGLDPISILLPPATAAGGEPSPAAGSPWSDDPRKP